jgi:ribosome-associated protein
MEEDDFISKTRRKKRMHDLQDVGRELVALSPEQLARLELPEALLEAVLECKRFNKHEAIRRQMQYIGKLMRDIDAEPIAAKLASLKSPTQRDNALFHLAEEWRLKLLADPLAADRFEREFPHADAKKLRALVRAAAEERTAGRAPKHFRELFHFVKEQIEEQARG